MPTLPWDVFLEKPLHALFKLNFAILLPPLRPLPYPLLVRFFRVNHVPRIERGV